MVNTGPIISSNISPADIAALAPRLRRYAVALVGSIPAADDLVQDCMERALAHRNSVRDPARLYNWLLAILHNMHMSACRRWLRQGVETPVDDLADTLALSTPPTDRMAVRDLIRAMGQLSDDQRQILLLNGLEGMSYREIADILDIPVGTVMSRLARAREKLRILLEGGEQQVVRRIR